VLIDRGEIYRSFTSLGNRMDPYVEVDLGRCSDYEGVNWRWIATTPTAPQGNRRPSWSYQLENQNFVADEDLRITVLVKNLWRKDVLVGIGHLKLSQDLINKRASAEDVKLYKRHWKGPEEHTGYVQVHLSFPPLKSRSPSSAGLSADEGTSMSRRPSWATTMASSLSMRSPRKADSEAGSYATLDDNGYRDILASNDANNMVAYLSRVCKLITPEDMEGELTKQTWKWMQDQQPPPRDFASLVQELRSLASAVSAVSPAVANSATTQAAAAAQLPPQHTASILDGLEDGPVAAVRRASMKPTLSLEAAIESRQATADAERRRSSVLKSQSGLSLDGGGASDGGRRSSIKSSSFSMESLAGDKATDKALAYAAYSYDPTQKISNNAMLDSVPRLRPEIARSLAAAPGRKAAIVGYQYWEREIVSEWWTPVVCTEGVRCWLARRFPCLPCLDPRQAKLRQQQQQRYASP